MAEPRLPKAFAPLPSARIEDETEWSGVEVKGEIETPEEISYLEIASSRLVQLRLIGRRYDRLRLVDVVLEDRDLSAATLEDASLVRVRFQRCRLSWLVAPGLRAKDVRLSASKLDGVQPAHVPVGAGQMEGCDFTAADFSSARLPVSRLLRCNLTQAQFSKTDLMGTVLHGSTLEGVKGREALSGVVIGSDQILPLSTSVFAALGIVVDDDHPAASPSQG